MRKHNLILTLFGMVIGGTAIYLTVVPEDKGQKGNMESVEVEFYREYDAAQIQPLPEIASIPEDKAALGDLLFHDKRLSKDNSVSCASCHALDTGGVDRLGSGVVVGGAMGTVNTPTVYNSSLNFRQFWDGRAATLEEQASGPVHNPIEMASNWKDVIAKLNNDPEYPKLFRKIYSDKLDFHLYYDDSIQQTGDWAV